MSPTKRLKKKIVKPRIEDPSQKKISSYFLSNIADNSKASGGSDIMLNNKAVSKFLVTPMLEKNVGVKNGNNSDGAISNVLTNEVLLDGKDNDYLALKDPFVISPSPECKLKKIRSLGISNKRKLVLSPTTKESHFKVGKLSLNSKTKLQDVKCKKRIAIDDIFVKNCKTKQNNFECDIEVISLVEDSNSEQSLDVKENISTECDEIAMMFKKVDGGSSSNILKEKMDQLNLLDDDVLKNFEDDIFEDPIVDNKFSNNQNELPDEIKERYRLNGRHKVIKWEKNYDSLILTVLSVADNLERHVILKGFWCNTVVKEGDIVNVLAEFDKNGAAVIDYTSGLIVVHPDVLISGTTVATSVFCQRKAIFSEWYRGIDEGNSSRVVGNIIHELFQQSISYANSCGNLNKEIVDKFFTEIMTKEKTILDMYCYKSSGNNIYNEVQSFLVNILAWVDKYMLKKIETPKPKNDFEEVKILNVCDIEENIWSPRYGVKGKVDVTAEVKLHSRGSNVMPIELKTGKSTYSSEHQGQVMLYSMLLSEKQLNPEGGLLLYLKDMKMKNIKDDFKCLQGLIQTRNEIALRVAEPIKICSTNVDTNNHSFKLSQMPDPICSAKFCKMCPYLSTCAIYQQVNRKETEHLTSNPEADKFFSENLTHLNEKDINYFVLWCGYIFLEFLHGEDKSKQTKNIWCKTAENREKKGLTYCKLLLVDFPNKVEEDGMHRFISLTKVKFGSVRSSLNISQFVVVSQENPLTLAVGTGYLMDIGGDYIDVKLDKNLYKKNVLSKSVYRIDSISMKSSWNTCLSNMARLMENNVTSQNLREIIIHNKKATFLEKLPKKAISKVKPILKKLNKPQQLAIIKSLMCEDYLLIKGMPGAGKTATIVALVEILVHYNRTVLLTSHTHSAVDNILLKLVDKGVDFLRLGNTDRVKPELINYTVNSALKHCKSVNELETLVKSKLVIATTCLGVNHPILSQKKIFDYCIVDEATQILQASCLGPLFQCRRFILVGDPNQLPPIVRCETIKKNADESLFTRLDNLEVVVELNMQYRMNKEIVRFANILSYNGSLQCAHAGIANSVLNINDNEELIDVKTPLTTPLLSKKLEHSVLFIDTDEIIIEEESKLVNTSEGILTLYISQLFIKTGLSKSQIGIITPYRDQVAYLLKLFKDNHHWNLEGLEVNTVDQFQGRDKDAVILSSVRNSFKLNCSDESILNDKRRINVAITRAKTKLIIIGKKSILNNFMPMKTILDNLYPEQQFILKPDVFEKIQNFVNSKI